MVVALRLLQHLDVGGSQLRPVNRQRQLIEFSGEGERNLIVLVVHRSAGIGSNVEVLIPLQDEGQGVFHGLSGHHRTVHLESARTALTDAASVVKGERGQAEAVVLEVELQGVLAGRQHIRALPLHAFEVDQVPQ